MKVLSQEEYKQYKQDLKDQGFNMPEITVNVATEETFRILEERIGPVPWSLLVD